jgi:hypothetical protein
MKKPETMKLMDKFDFLIYLDVIPAKLKVINPVVDLV